MAALARVKNAARPPQESLDLVARVLGPAASADRWASGIRFLNAQGVDNATLTNLGVPAQFSADAQATVKGLAKPANEAQGVDAQAARAWLARPENKGKDMADFLKYEKGITPAINNYIQMHPGGAEGAAPKAADGTALAGADLLKSFGATGGTVKAVAEGRQDPPKGMALKSPYWAKVMQQVYQYDPDWSEQRAQIRKAFTTGPDGRNIGALNTATAHLDQLVEASKALNNGTWQPGNKVYNYFAGQFGSAKITNREFVMNALAGETASALKGNATDPEIAHVMKTLSADFSPDQAEGIGETGLHVLGAKLNTYHERYQQQIPGDKVWSPVLPTAQKVFNKYGISVGDADAGGSAAAAPTQGGAKPGGAALHTIKIGTKTYTYKGSGDTSDLSNYTEKK